LKVLIDLVVAGGQVVEGFADTALGQPLLVLLDNILAQLIQ
jgi:hypothetical protein